MVDGRGPFDFVLDTAATKSVLAIDLARELGYEVSTPPAGESLIALRGTPLMIGSLAVAGVREGPVQVAVADLEVLVSQLKTSIRGIIGFDFLSSRRITIDYRSHTLTIE